MFFCCPFLWCELRVDLWIRAVAGGVVCLQPRKRTAGGPQNGCFGKGGFFLNMAIFGIYLST